MFSGNAQERKKRIALNLMTENCRLILCNLYVCYAVIERDDYEPLLN